MKEVVIFVGASAPLNLQSDTRALTRKCDPRLVGLTTRSVFTLYEKIELRTPTVIHHWGKAT